METHIQDDPITIFFDQLHRTSSSKADGLLNFFLMEESKTITYQRFADISDLNAEDADLLEAAREVVVRAYAPYSNFFVGAVALLENGEYAYGVNQENASYPVTICAERVLLANVAMQYPNTVIKTMAISYKNHHEKCHSNKPISPCGVCRQSLVEYESRQSSPIKLILSGADGEVLVINGADSLLPFAFGAADMS